MFKRDFSVPLSNIYQDKALCWGKSDMGAQLLSPSGPRPSRRKEIHSETSSTITEMVSHLTDVGKMCTDEKNNNSYRFLNTK